MIIDTIKKSVLTGARTLNTSFKDWRDSHFTIRTLQNWVLPLALYNTLLYKPCSTV